MKLTQEPQGFKPVNITLETVNEVNILRNVLQFYTANHHVIPNEVANLREFLYEVAK